MTSGVNPDATYCCKWAPRDPFVAVDDRAHPLKRAARVAIKIFKLHFEFIEDMIHRVVIHRFRVIVLLA